MAGRTANGASLVQSAMDAVRAHMRDNDLKVGDKLPGEGQFAVALGVSRAVIREAFGALGALKQIDVGNGRVARVAAIDGSVIATSLDHAVATAQISPSHIWEVRRTLESRAAGLAARNRTDAEARSILGLAAAMRNASGGLDDLTRLDITFHQAVAQATHNPLLHQIVRSFAPIMATAVPAAWRTRTAVADRELMLDRHHGVARAIAERDEAAALKAMGEHFDEAVGNLLQ
jgi:GntR family transcriptional regulator, transcriptional repressor for pyruvate dehydrogenase complex